ncbi:small VCP/p97-interacting protein-like [Macrobrachium nipponense]|uniref:small VCP/p97-interacting protein-like n=1 Tax=Macrobrachium nipponense TaxID=159736 RepID=UPI0030C88D98
MALGQQSVGRRPVFFYTEERRRQMAEAAEKRLKAQEGRGLKDPEALKQRQKRQEELEQKEKQLESASEGGLRWQVN